MRLFKYLVALAALLFAVSPVFADIAPPQRPQPHRNDEVRRDLPFSRMSIERVEGLREARLQIPRAQLERMGLTNGAGRGGTQSGGLRGAGTVVGGLFLSLAVALTGLLLVRSRRRGGVAVGRAAIALLACACAAGLAGVAAYANAGLPEWQQQNPGTLIKAASAKPLTGSIRIEVVEEGTELKLLIPAKSQAGGDEEE